MSRKENEENLGAVIDRLLKAYGLEDGYYAAAVITHWEKLMGPAIARRTKEIRLDRGTLTIYLDSSTLRQELSFAKEKIADRINKELGQRLVAKVELR